MMDIRWQEPPPDKRGSKNGRAAVIDKMVQELQENPGRWALVKEATWPSSVHPWKKRGCETRTVSGETSPGKHDVYARWPEKENPDG